MVVARGKTTSFLEGYVQQSLPYTISMQKADKATSLKHAANVLHCFMLVHASQSLYELLHTYTCLFMLPHMPCMACLDLCFSTHTCLMPWLSLPSHSEESTSHSSHTFVAAVRLSVVVQHQPTLSCNWSVHRKWPCYIYTALSPKR